MIQTLKMLGYAAVVSSLIAISPAFAAKDKPGKERTLTGELKCAKCALKEGDTCQNVIVAEGKKGKTETVYLEQNDVAKKAHEEVCKEPKKATVTGAVKKAKGGDKVTMTASKIEFAK
jgi:hypothetical protein